MLGRRTIPAPRKTSVAAAARISGPRRVARPSALPVLPMLAACLVLLGVGQLGLWWWESRLPGNGVPEPVTAGAGNPFVAIRDFQRSLMMPKVSGDGRSALRQPLRLRVEALPQNLQFGDAMGRVTVTIFTDFACGACREQVRQWTAGLPVQGVKQVYKFWPKDAGRLTPGMAVEMARRAGVVPAFWRSLQGAGRKDLSDEELLTMLDRAGVSLSEQRTVLMDEVAAPAAVLEADIAAARDARLPAAPVVLVDDYVLDGELLQPELLKTYVQRRLDGQAMFEQGNLWLMQK